MSQVTVVAEWKIKTESVGWVLEQLEQLLSESRREPGTLRYELFRKANSENEILIFEEYKSLKAFESHKVTAHFQKLIPLILPYLEERSVTVFSGKQKL